MIGSWLARKDSNLQSPDPESSDLDRAREPIFELSPAPRAVWIRECQPNTPRRVMRTTEFVCESSELTVLRRLYDCRRLVPARILDRHDGTAR
jgi:hypothetical protein